MRVPPGRRGADPWYAHGTTVPPVTRADEGWDRRAFTVTQVFALQDAGLLDDEPRFELWEGELVPTKPKHNRHETRKRRLDRFLQRGLPDDLDVAVEPSLDLSDITLPGAGYPDPSGQDSA